MQILAVFVAALLIIVSAKIAFTDLLDKPVIKERDEK
jgi:hypothetical protein